MKSNYMKVLIKVGYLLGFILILYLFFKYFSIAALVDKKPIFNRKINRLFETEFQGYNRGVREELFNQQGRRILEKEIDRQLILQEAEKQKISVSQKEIELITQEKLKERSYSDLAAYVQDYKTTQDDLRVEFEVELISIKILGEDIIDSSEEIKNCYEESGWIIWQCDQNVKELFFRKIGEKYSPWLNQLRNSANIRYFVDY